MPRHAIFNRRDFESPLVRKTVLVSEEGLEGAAKVAERLSVSQGSVIDTALRHLAALNDLEVADLLRAHGHLRPDEYDFVRKRITNGG